MERIHDQNTNLYEQKERTGMRSLADVRQPKPIFENQTDNKMEIESYEGELFIGVPRDFKPADLD